VVGGQENVRKFHRFSGAVPCARFQRSGLGTLAGRQRLDPSPVALGATSPGKVAGSPALARLSPWCGRVAAAAKSRTWEGLGRFAIIDRLAIG
jgi:hypothetical protein